MDHPLPLAVATAQLQQALRDFERSHAAAMATDKACLQLSASMAFSSLKNLERSGWTDGGRKSLRTAIELVKSIMGRE